MCIPTEKVEKAKCLVGFSLTVKPKGHCTSNPETLWSPQFPMQMHCARQSISAKNICIGFFINETASSCEYHKRN